MKFKIIFFAIGLISFNLASAQLVKDNLVYGGTEINVGNYSGIDLNLNYILKEKYSFKLSYTANIKKPKSQPEDYTTGVIGILVWGLNNPADQFESFGASVGRTYKLNEKGTIRANLSAGLGYTIMTEPENWTKKEKDKPVSLGENYTYDNVEYKTVSLIINPKIEFPISRYFGFTVSPTMQINKDRTYFGVGFGAIFGLLR